MSFLRKLMFWRTSPDNETAPAGNDPTAQSPEELEYQAEREEQLLQDERQQDNLAP
jgi:hypothetical protein